MRAHRWFIGLAVAAPITALLVLDIAALQRLASAHGQVRTLQAEVTALKADAAARDKEQGARDAALDAGLIGIEAQVVALGNDGRLSQAQVSALSAKIDALKPQTITVPVPVPTPVIIPSPYVVTVTASPRPMPRCTRLLGIGC